MIHLLLVDDHTSLRGALAFMLEHAGDTVVTGQAGTLAEARALLGTIPIDVMLLELDLPDGDGLELLPALRECTPGAVAVVLTRSARPDSPALAVAAGAVGFLHKSATTAEIVTAIHRAAAGEMLFTPIEIVMLTRQAAQHQVRTQPHQQALEGLTRREQDVLCVLAVGLDNQAISNRLGLGTATTRTHVSRILGKLGVESRLQAALLAMRYGMVDPNESP